MVLLTLSIYCLIQYISIGELFVNNLKKKIDTKALGFRYESAKDEEETKR